MEADCQGPKGCFAAAGMSAGDQCIVWCCYTSGSVLVRGLMDDENEDMRHDSDGFLDVFSLVPVESKCEVSMAFRNHF